MVHRPLRPELLSKSLAEYNYATTEANVDVLKFIQIGLTFSDEQATQPMIEPDDRRRPCAWQFNFRGFDPRIDVADMDHISSCSDAVGSTSPATPQSVSIHDALPRC